MSVMWDGLARHKRDLDGYVTYYLETLIRETITLTSGEGRPFWEPPIYEHFKPWKFNWMAGLRYYCDVRAIHWDQFSHLPGWQHNIQYQPYPGAVYSDDEYEPTCHESMDSTRKGDGVEGQIETETLVNADPVVFEGGHEPMQGAQAESRGPPNGSGPLADLPNPSDDMPGPVGGQGPRRTDEGAPQPRPCDATAFPEHSDGEGRPTAEVSPAEQPQG